MILYYVHDPMCSWCWGFRPTWQKIYNAVENDVEIRYLLGGLAPDSNEPMPEDMQKAIAGYWRKVQSHIPGTEFNFEFWDKCKPKRSTYPACRAVIAARKQKPEIEKAMILGIQKAYYLNAKNPSDNETLIEIAESLGLDAIQFEEDIDSNETQQQLEKEILFGRQIGAQGFPSMVLEKQGQYQYLPLDYNNPNPVIEIVKNLSNP